jgi:hypothetical protein
LLGAFGSQSVANPNSTAAKIKATATASKIDPNGKQSATVTIEIEKGCYIYASPNHECLADAEIRLKITAEKPVQCKISYPKGKELDAAGEKIYIYQGFVRIDADVVRTAGDTSSLIIEIWCRGSDGNI